MARDLAGLTTMLGNVYLAKLAALIATNTPPKDFPPSLIDACVQAVPLCVDDPTVFRPIDVSQLRVGQLVTFWYLFPKTHAPFRFGVVVNITSTICTVWTMNLITVNEHTPCVPSYHSYKLEGVSRLKAASTNFMTRGLQLFGDLATRNGSLT